MSRLAQAVLTLLAATLIVAVVVYGVLRLYA